MPSKETEAPALATAIISKFIEELAAQDGLADVAGRLRSTVLDQKIGLPHRGGPRLKLV